MIWFNYKSTKSAKTQKRRGFKMKVGVIGAGRIGKVHIKKYFTMCTWIKNQNCGWPIYERRNRKVC